MNRAHPRIRWRGYLAAPAVLVVAILAGCGGGASAPDAASSSASSRPAPGCDDPRGCPDFAFYLSDFCEVQAIRDLLADGRLSAGDLPAWADLTEQGGVPVVIDFGRHQSVSPDRRLDQLDASVLTPAQVQISRSATRDCRDHATAFDFHQNTRLR